MLFNYGINSCIGCTASLIQKLFYQEQSKICYTAKSESLMENHISRKMITEMLKRR